MVYQTGPSIFTKRTLPRCITVLLRVGASKNKAPALLAYPAGKQGCAYLSLQVSCLLERAINVAVE
jgi:hypothetical protein